ncbi:MAG: nucleotidyl transferase AbiEii/AbiGii toxin family protein [Candidatus Niyogibacteria bacterium]|nr:nucleotidyl transferase AbiEii/AbiGii toxin family protein [Candidatus Niyogibacteria bacterium]
MGSIGRSIHNRLDSNYYLAGGTALSLLLGHRKSVDMDYFINGQIDTERLNLQLIEMFGIDKVKITFQEKDTLWVNIDGVKVFFITRLSALLKPISDQEDFRLAQLEDITIMKLSAIYSRDEYKDYFDLACLASVTDVRSWVPWSQKLFPNNDPISWMVALSALDQIPIIPLNVQSNFLAIDPIKIIKKSELEIVKFIQG